MEISDEVIAVCATNAALRTAGVADLSGGIRESLSRNILRKELMSRGVKVSQSEEGVQADIYVIVRYGVKIPEVAWDLQENVKKEVEHMTELPVKAVNIHVLGVECTARR
ncbi:Asp23/Gls24 family envelope stress response protein [Bacilliculturomica massiliensis]|uniref:Asp23/Gls24 family envelope stress response protein n=1 Tax=Bacilliculturomica massiliensis TaxID=1917867 RepID=UPI00103244E5|nr:Asp23/Gls24 family envelope stress response protein [Bacilliculturomica massiliensis]